MATSRRVMFYLFYNMKWNDYVLIPPPLYTAFPFHSTATRTVTSRLKPSFIQTVTSCGFLPLLLKFLVLWISLISHMIHRSVLLNWVRGHMIAVGWVYLYDKKWCYHLVVMCFITYVFLLFSLLLRLIKY